MIDWLILNVVIVNTISWKELDLFSRDFQLWCILGLGWRSQLLRSKGQSLRSRWVKLGWVIVVSGGLCIKAAAIDCLCGPLVVDYFVTVSSTSRWNAVVDHGALALTCYHFDMRDNLILKCENAFGSAYIIHSFFREPNVTFQDETQYWHWQ